MKSNIKLFLTNILKILPGYGFLLDMYTFIKHPAMYDGTHEYSPLINSGANLLKSTLIIGTLITAFGFLSIKTTPIANFKLIFNQLYWYLILLIQPIKFGFFFWLCLSIVSRLKKNSWHIVYFLQVLQSYAVLNVIAFLLYCIAINRIILNGNFNIPLNNIDLFIGVALSVLAFILIYRLLIAPSFCYLSLYYKRPISAIIILLSIVAAYFLSTLINFVDWWNLVNKNEFCDFIYQLKAEHLQINEKSFLNQCIYSFSLHL
ncbi:hypothetical protein [Citrobacter sp. MNAZ 1397]|uniref:hypothetical protein n=1 Tax=Citrobacter sp. MNAZ 1397 TaxID=2911205 RepID=UPI0020274E92|nr:hypothetical protein [Citrobacter sp. MNAZ 1397]MCL9672727.1 hypothetical protein [Citrobacter sp. MNAZ 1397]